MTLLEEVAKLLQELGLGVYEPVGNRDVFLYALPPTPDAALVLTRAAGRESDAHLPYDEPVVQIGVRGPKTGAPDSEARAQAIYDALHGLGERALAGGTRLVLAVGTDGGPVYQTRDGDGRDQWIVNMRMELYRPGGNRPQT
ncbi:minor capsid protein [Nocardia arthritidis]|uniref:DUF3168 domain-containing protein n=1 Tax=Nocardia arthritidis TaxID=228602 RepID=A0A6G9YK73_9NOCA|nr:minor capsid protein [Nocardia arthritidis]QIS13588.1 hypothetical protein F5544_28685 [Nocardia arthritidis]